MISDAGSRDDSPEDSAKFDPFEPDSSLENSGPEDAGLEDSHKYTDDSLDDRNDEIRPVSAVSSESEIEALQPTKSRRTRPSKRKTAASETSTKKLKARRKNGSYADELVRLQPQGISAASAIGRPVLILKDNDTGEVLPIWLQALDASVAMAELSQRSNATPHSTAHRVIELLGGKIRRCVFEDLIGHHQFAELQVVQFDTFREGSRNHRLHNLRVRADEAMSFCLQSGAEFFATREFMARSRDIDMDLAKLEYNLGEGLLPELKEELENSSRIQPYMM